MLVRGKACLTKGVLKENYEKVKVNLIDKIDSTLHAKTYVGEHEEMYAEPEFTGKYIDISVKAYTEHSEKKALENASQVVQSIQANIREDGYLGCLEKGKEFENFSVWNQAFTIMGLVSYYNATREESALNVAERSAKYVMEHFVREGYDILDAPNYGTQHISMLYGLCSLYEITKQDVYKEYIFHIVNRLKGSDLDFFNFDSILNLRSRKAIENIVVLLGILKYGDLFGDHEALSGAERYWDEVNATQIRNTGNGTIEELWSEGGNGAMLLGAETRPNENCVAVGWIELSLALFYKNQDEKYLDAIDKTLYNHILSAIAPDGSDFAYYRTNYGKSVRETEESAYKCCRYRGFTLFTYMNDMLYFEDDATLIPMLYASSVYEGNGIKVVQETNYPYQGNVKFVAETGKGITKTLKLRIPKGYKAKLFVDGERLDIATCNGYLDIEIKENTKTEIELDLTPIIEAEYGEIHGKKCVSLTYGVVLLALTGATEETKLNVDNLEIKRVEETDGHYLMFSAKGETNGNVKDVTLCDYSTADDFTVWPEAI